MKSTRTTALPFRGAGIVFLIIGMAQSSATFFVLGIALIVLSSASPGRSSELDENIDE